MAVLAACEHLRDQFLMSLLAETGMRVGQALGLRHADFVSRKHEVHIVPRADITTLNNSPNCPWMPTDGPQKPLMRLTIWMTWMAYQAEITQQTMAPTLYQSICLFGGRYWGGTCCCH